MNVYSASDKKNEIKTRLLSALETLRKELGVTQNLRDIGIKKDDIPGLVKNAMHDPCMATNPKRPSLLDLEKIYEKLL
jgi:alcohol dehydrogenase class IV